MRSLRLPLLPIVGLAFWLPATALAQPAPGAAEDAPGTAEAVPAKAEAEAGSAAEPATEDAGAPAAEESASSEAKAEGESASGTASEDKTPTESPASQAAEPSSGALTQVDTKDAPEVDASDAEADAEAAAMEEAMLLDAATGSDDYKIDIYGFADFGYSNTIGDVDLSRSNSTMFVGNLNVYIAGDLGDRWSTLAEVRFTYLPHGSTMTDSTGDTFRYNGRVTDYTDLGRPTEVGGIVIERAWLEYGAHYLANIRVGQFLTPYGIWNVDHGSPVIIGVRKPYIVGEDLLPESQTGVQIYGSDHFGVVELGYNLTLSNGRGPLDKYQDLDSNKAIGGRLFARADGSLGTLQVGFSGYGGKYTDSGEETVFSQDGFDIIYPVTEEYNEVSLAADIKYEYGGFLVQGEVIRRDVAYEEPRPDTGFGSVARDFRSLGFYGLGGYRFDFLGMMPFIGGEFYESTTSTFTEATAIWTGLNIRPTPRVVLKAVYTHSFRTEFSDFRAVDFQAAWSF